MSASKRIGGTPRTVQGRPVWFVTSGGRLKPARLVSYDSSTGSYQVKVGKGSGSVVTAYPRSHGSFANGAGFISGSSGT